MTCTDYLDHCGVSAGRHKIDRRLICMFQRFHRQRIGVGGNTDYFAAEDINDKRGVGES